jgi:hypothetical protein
VETYQDVIVLVIAGHTHDDSWVNIGPFTQFLTPSITPFSFKNPSLRLFVTNELYEPVRIDTYIMDLGKANAKGRAEWVLEYSLPQAYGMPDLSPASFNQVARFDCSVVVWLLLCFYFSTRNLLTNSSLWDLWNQFHKCSSPGPAPCTTQECKVVEYCNLMSPTLVEWNDCMTTTK